MRLFRFKGTFLQHISLIFVLVVLVPVLCLGWASYKLSQDALLENSSVMMENTMELSKSHLESVFKEADYIHLHMINSDDLLALLKKPPQNRGEEGIYTLTLNTLLDTFKSIEEIRYIYWYPMDSEGFADYRKYVLIDNYADTAWYTSLKDKESKPVWVLEKVVRLDPMNSEWVLTQYRQLKDKTTLRPLGIIGVSINVQALTRNMLLPHNIQGQRMLIVDEQGGVLADTLSQNIRPPGEAAQPFLKASGSDTSS